MGSFIEGNLSEGTHSPVLIILSYNHKCVKIRSPALVGVMGGAPFPDPILGSAVLTNIRKAGQETRRRVRTEEGKQRSRLDKSLTESCGH